MSKLSFRARALDASRPLAVWLAEELPELPDYSAISRAVPQMPSGMEKEEECEHHLQRAICTGLIIPTPEVSDAADLAFYERCYPPDYRMPRQLIHVQPLCLEQETPEYDMDSEDERWLRQQHYAELTELKFEEMMDRLERSSGQTVVTLNEAKLLLERRDDLVIAVYDYWLNKRLKTVTKEQDELTLQQHPLILSVRTESRVGQPANNPYLAFRRRTEKMQTRKNRKNDESSYEKMLKLRRDLSRAASLLELVARRERAKRDLVRLTALLAEKRFHAGDFAGHLLAELAAATAAAAPLRVPASAVASSGAGARRERERERERARGGAQYAPRAPAAPPDARQPERARADWRSARSRDKRQRRKHRHHGSSASLALRESGAYSSSEEEAMAAGAAAAAAAAAAGAAGGGPARGDDAPTAPADDGPFAFRRKAGVYYQMPTSSLCGDVSDGSESPSSHKENSHARHNKYRFTLTSISHPYPKCIGFARRRLGRGGRVVLDRISTPLDDLWPHLDYPATSARQPTPDEDARHRYPYVTTRDHRAGGKHPWRHAFRQHHRNDPAKWTTSDSVVVKQEKNEPEDSNKLNGGDISYSEVEAGVRAGLKRARKRTRRRPSETSLDSAAELEPHEAEFSRLLDQVNSEWLHFRPKTPPERPVEADADERALTADTPLAVQLRLAEPPGSLGCLFADGSPFTTSDFTLADLYGEPPLEPDAGIDASGEDSTLLTDNFGLTDAQVESILSDTDLKAIADEDLNGRKNSLDLLRPDDADALLEELVSTEAPFLLSGQSGAGRVGAAASPDSGPRRSDELGCSVVRVAPLPPERITLEAPEPVEEAPTPPPAPPKAIEKDPKVQPKAVQTKHSPLKKHIITSAAHRLEAPVVTQPAQVVTVTVSEGLKARLQGQMVLEPAGAVQNGPYAAAGGVVVSAASVATVSRDGTVSAVGATTSSPRRVSAPLVHLTPALHPKHLQLASSSVVVSHAGRPLQHVAPNKLKVLHAHTLTQSQRAQLLAQSRSAAPPLQLRAAPAGAVAQFYEIRGGQLARAPQLVSVARPPRPRAGAPQRVSVLDGRQLVPVRQQIQLKGRGGAPPPATSIALAGPVVASLLQRGAAAARPGQKIAIASAANVQAFAAFTHAQQLRARQARLVTQPQRNAVVDLEAPTTSGAAAAAADGAGDADAATNGSPAVRRRAADGLPMEVT